MIPKALRLTPLFMLLAAFADAQEPQLPPKNELQLFVLAGQSNMAGVGGHVHPRHQEPIPAAFILNRNMLLRREDKTPIAPMPEPLFEVFGTDKKELTARGVGPEWGFVTTLHERDPEMRIGIVKIPASGSNIERWINDPSLPRGGGDYYPNVLETVREAMKHGELKGFLWHQGESNSGSQDYDQLFERMIEDYRAAFNAPDLPVIAGTVRENGSDPHPVNQGLAAAAGRMENVRIVSSVRTLTDNVHYDAASQDELGRRFANAYLTEIGKPEQLRLTTTALPEGVAGTCYTAKIVSEGGDGSFRSWTCEGLPDGLRLEAGVIRGELPTVAHPIDLLITVTDNSGSDRRTFSLPVQELPANRLALEPCDAFTLNRKHALNRATESLVSPNAKYSGYHRSYFSFRIPPAFRGARIDALRLPVVMSGGPFPVNLSISVVTDPAWEAGAPDPQSPPPLPKSIPVGSVQIDQTQPGELTVSLPEDVAKQVDETGRITFQILDTRDDRGGITFIHSSGSDSPPQLLIAK